MQINVFPACIGGDFTDPLRCGDTGLQLLKEGLGILGMDGNQQTTCRLGIVEEILQMERHIAFVHMGFREIAVAVHALGENAHAGQLCSFI